MLARVHEHVAIAGRRRRIAASTGPVFMKFGRVPTTYRNVLIGAGHARRVRELSSAVVTHERARGLVRAVARARRSRRPIVVVAPQGWIPGPLGVLALRAATVVAAETEEHAAALAARARLVPRPVVLAGPPGRAARLESVRMRAAAAGARGPRPRRRAPKPAALLARAVGPRSARLALAAGDEATAAARADEALRRDPGDRRALVVRAVLLERAGEPTRALHAARAAADGESVRRLEGQLRVLEPVRRAPRAPRAPAARAEAGRRVLVLLESSLPHAPAGYALRSAALLRGLVRAGCVPLVVTRLGFPAARGRRDFAAVEWVEGVAHHRLWVPGVRRYTAVPLDEQLDRAVVETAALAQRFDPSLVWAASPHLNGLVGLALRERLDVPLVYDVRGFPELTWEAERATASELSRARAAAEAATMAAADEVVTLGEVMRTRILERAVDPSRVSVLGHVVETGAAAAGPAGGVPVVGLAATLRRYEGVEVLLRAVAAVRAEGSPVRALVLGDGPALAGLRETASQLGFEPGDVLPGRVPAAAARAGLDAMDVVVVPRLDEGVCRWVVPLKPVEALAAGRPLIASRLPALEEIGGEGRARLVAPGDHGALAEAIAADLADPAARTARAESARRWALRAHGVEAFDARLRSLLARR